MSTLSVLRLADCNEVIRLCTQNHPTNKSTNLEMRRLWWDHMRPQRRVRRGVDQPHDLEVQGARLAAPKVDDGWDCGHAGAAAHIFKGTWRTVMQELQTLEMALAGASPRKAAAEKQQRTGETGMQRTVLGDEVEALLWR